jgi:hypothetical protein
MNFLSVYKHVLGTVACLLLLSGKALAVEPTPPAPSSHQSGDLPLLEPNLMKKETKDRWTARPIAVEVHLSFFGSPTGNLGLMFDWSPAPWFSIGAGAGLGGSGPQVATAMRFRYIFTKEFAIALGTGLSAGKYDAEKFFQPIFELDHPYTTRPVKVWNPAYWGNIELSFEFRVKTGIVVRPYAGHGWNLQPSGAKCYSYYHNGPNDGKRATDDMPCSDDHGHTFLYGGLAMGATF